jgi:hypothetical protein
MIKFTSALPYNSCIVSQELWDQWTMLDRISEQCMTPLMSPNLAPEGAEDHSLLRSAFCAPGMVDCRWCPETIVIQSHQRIHGKAL